jgi:hypothetical protein
MSPRDFSTVKRREPIARVNRDASRKEHLGLPCPRPGQVRLRRGSLTA